MLVNKENITKYIPQRFPFVMVDTVEEIENKSIITSFTVETENILFYDNKFQASGLIENMAQTAAARAGFVQQNKSEKIRLGYIGAIKSLKINKLPVAGETIFTKAETIYEYNDFSIVKVKVYNKSEIISECELKIILV